VLRYDGGIENEKVIRHILIGNCGNVVDEPKSGGFEVGLGLSGAVY
jgi:hypothetical protein